ncbi:unnamed protein product, partial [Ranitomeya imitator]
LRHHTLPHEAPSPTLPHEAASSHINTRGCVPTHYHMRLRPHTLPNEAASPHITTRGCVLTHYHTRLCPHTLPHDAASPHITTRGSGPHITTSSTSFLLQINNTYVENITSKTAYKASALLFLFSIPFVEQRSTVFENCFTSMLHGVNHLLAIVTCYPSPGCSDYIPQCFAICWLCLRNGIFDVTRQVFYRIKVRGLGWTLHNLKFVGPGTKILLVYFLRMACFTCMESSFDRMFTSQQNLPNASTTPQINSRPFICLIENDITKGLPTLRTLLERRNEWGFSTTSWGDSAYCSAVSSMAHGLHTDSIRVRSIKWRPLAQAAMCNEFLLPVVQNC